VLENLGATRGIRTDGLVTTHSVRFRWPLRRPAVEKSIVSSSACDQNQRPKRATRASLAACQATLPHRLAKIFIIGLLQAAAIASRSPTFRSDGCLRQAQSRAGAAPSIVRTRTGSGFYGFEGSFREFLGAAASS
jgi:hypothetical protein